MVMRVALAISTTKITAVAAAAMLLLAELVKAGVRL
jgi:hypothetical protein